MNAFIAIARTSNFGIGIVGWIIVGLLAGWFGHLFADDSRTARVADIVLGLVGALIGGVMFGLLLSGTAGLWAALVVAFVLGFAFTWIVAASIERSAR